MSQKILIIEDEEGLIHVGTTAYLHGLQGVAPHLLHQRRDSGLSHPARTLKISSNLLAGTEKSCIFPLSVLLWWAEIVSISKPGAGVPLHVAEDPHN